MRVLLLLAIIALGLFVVYLGTRPTSARASLKRAEKQRLVVQNENLLKLVADLEQIGFDVRATEPISSDLIINRVREARGNKEIS